MKPALTPLETLYETRHGKELPLPPKLARLYGRLRMPLARARPYVIGNFVTTLDGVVSPRSSTLYSASAFTPSGRLVNGWRVNYVSWRTDNGMHTP